jgi:glycosyltransferase involved in cell wall biosynthesis
MKINISVLSTLFQNRNMSLSHLLPKLQLTQSTGPTRLKLITQFYPPDFAASGQLMDELACNLAKQGLSVQVFTAQPGYAFAQEQAAKQEIQKQVEVIRSNFLRGFSRRWAGRTISSLAFCAHALWHLRLAANRGDVILLTSEPPFLPLIGLVIKWLFDVKFITLIYDLYPEVAVELGVLSSNHWLVSLWHQINRWVWYATDEIIVPCQTMKDRVVEHCPEIADKITVIHNWADSTLIQPIAKEENMFAQAQDLINPFVVLYSGNMGRCHDMETILEAAKILRDESIIFLFIGDGAKRSWLEAEVKQHQLKNCRFLPYQPKQDLPLSLTAGDILLVSVDRGMEGLVAPSKFYSALCAGRPIAVICESHSYLKSLIAQANCGIALENGNAQGLAKFIQATADDRETAEQLGKNGHYFAREHFTPRRIAQKYHQIIERTAMLGKGTYQKKPLSV